jgi:hypothetical protein
MAGCDCQHIAFTFGDTAHLRRHGTRPGRLGAAVAEIGLRHGLLIKTVRFLSSVIMGNGPGGARLVEL